MLRKILIVAAMSAAMLSASAIARDRIEIVGSSTVYPFATVVAEQFGKTTRFKTPKIESTGSGGGLKLFCAGVGIEHPDITNASRRIKKSEQEKCARNGITEIVEVKIGYDGIVMANAKNAPKFNLTRRQIFLALAKDIPGPDGKLIANPYKRWSDIDKSLPNEPIEVLGPPPSSGTRDAFVELALEGGAKKYADLKALRGAEGEKEVKALMAKLGIPISAYKKKGKSVFKAVAHAIREDGAYIEAGENDNLIVNKLKANPHALGVFGFSFLDQNSDAVQGSTIDGQEPTFEAISDGSYPLSRALYFYVKKAHAKAVPGIPEYLAEFTSDKASGEDGYLVDRGLIPAPDAEREQVRKAAMALTPMKKL